MGLSEALRKFAADLRGPVEENGNTVRALQQPVRQPMESELGSSGLTKYGSLNMTEYLPELRGIQAYKVFDKMRRSDAQIRAMLRLVKTPITSAQWYVQPCHDTPECRMQAAFVQWNLFQAMDHSFVRFIWECLYMLDYGFYIFEKVYELQEWTPPKEESGSRPRAKQYWTLQKFAPRHPMSIEEFQYDENGVAIGIKHQKVDGRNNSTTRVEIPMTKLLLLTLDEESEDPVGMSILRSAYKHWYYKEQLYKIDAIQKERHGIGIPKIILPVNFSPADKVEANRMGRNLRTNEEAHVTLPPGWDIEMLEIKTNLVNVLESAEHHDLMIARNVLGQFINLGSTTSGARALGGEQIEIFMKSLRYVADIIRSEINLKCIPELIYWNFRKHDGYPELRVRRIGEEGDWRAFSVAVRNLVESGVVTPDDDLEAWVRETVDMPIPSEEAMDRSPDDRLQVGQEQALRTPGASGQRQEEV